MSGVYATALKLLVCFCLQALSGVTLGQDNGPDVVKVVVEEGRAVILPCSLSTKQNLVSVLFDWRKDGQKKEVFMYDGGIHYNNGHRGQDEQFKGRVSHFRDELKHGNASIIITDTKVADSGDYTCAFPRLQPRQKLHIELVVAPIWKDRSEEKATAAPQPYVRTLNATEDSALLQCEVQGASLKPKLEWQDSTGNILPAEEPQVSERGGRHYVTLLTTVTMSGRYRCVVKQEEIHHVTAAETYVFINSIQFNSITEKLSEASSSKEIIGWVGGWISGVLTLAAIQALLVATKRITVRRNKGSPPQTNGSYKPPSEMMTLQTNNVTERV